MWITCMDSTARVFSLKWKAIVRLPGTSYPGKQWHAEGTPGNRGQGIAKVDTLANYTNGSRRDGIMLDALQS